MAIKMVHCTICHQEVTKKKTLDLTTLGGGTGRACRSHDEVQHLLEAKSAEEQAEKDARTQKIEEAVQFMYQRCVVNDYPVDNTIVEISNHIRNVAIMDQIIRIIKERYGIVVTPWY